LLLLLLLLLRLLLFAAMLSVATMMRGLVEEEVEVEEAALLLLGCWQLSTSELETPALARTNQTPPTGTPQHHMLYGGTPSQLPPSFLYLLLQRLFDLEI
jgi:hypothetical protein